MEPRENCLLILQYTFKSSYTHVCGYLPLHSFLSFLELHQSCAKANIFADISQEFFATVVDVYVG